MINSVWQCGSKRWVLHLLQGCQNLYDKHLIKQGNTGGQERLHVFSFLFFSCVKFNTKAKQIFLGKKKCQIDFIFNHHIPHFMYPCNHIESAWRYRRWHLRWPQLFVSFSSSQTQVHNRCSIPALIHKHIQHALIYLSLHQPFSLCYYLCKKGKKKRTGFVWKKDAVAQKAGQWGRQSHADHIEGIHYLEASYFLFSLKGRVRERVSLAKESDGEQRRGQARGGVGGGHGEKEKSVHERKRALQWGGGGHMLLRGERKNYT